MSCYVCQSPTGCERCAGGPGEQGFSHDERELIELRDEVSVLQGLVLRVEVACRAGVGCPWCGAPKGQHEVTCPAFSGAGVVRQRGSR